MPRGCHRELELPAHQTRTRHDGGGGGDDDILPPLFPRGARTLAEVGDQFDESDEFDDDDDDDEFDDDEFDDDALHASMLPVSLQSGRLLPGDMDGSDEKGLTCTGI